MIEGLKTEMYALHGIKVVQIVRGRVYENFSPSEEDILIGKGLAEKVEEKVIPEEGFSLGFALMMDDKTELLEYAAKYDYELSPRKKLENMKADLEKLVG